MNIDKDLTPRNSKGQPHGYWEVYWSNGDLYYKCVYHNGSIIGYYEYNNYFHDNKLTKLYHL